MKIKHARKSNSSEVTAGSAKTKLEPRLSTGKTSIIPEEPTELQPLNQFSYNLSKLTIARNILIPLINEIISNATSFSNKQLQNIVEKKGPICKITEVEFNRAKMASDIVEEVKNDLEIADIVPLAGQTQFFYNATVEYDKDTEENKVCVDKTLMKALVNLHDMISETIMLLKSIYSDPGLEAKKVKSQSTDKNVRKSLEEKIRKSSLYTNLAKDFVVVDPQNNRNSNEVEEYEPIISSGTNKAKVPTRTAEASTSLDSDNIKSTTVVPSTSVPIADRTLLVDVSTGSEEAMVSDKEVLTVDVPKRKTIDEGTQISARNSVKYEVQETCCELELGDNDEHKKCNDEIQKLRNMLQNLIKRMDDTVSDRHILLTPTTNDPQPESPPRFSDAQTMYDTPPETPPKGSFTQTIHDTPPQSPHVSVTPIIHDTEQENSVIIDHADLSTKSQTEILECLKELDQMKDLLQRVGNLSIDTEGKSIKQNCCSYINHPHVHARLNKVPVILKLNKSTIDILLVDKKGSKCKCVKPPKNEIICKSNKVWQLNLNNLNKNLDLPISDFRLEIDDSRFNFNMFDNEEAEMSSISLTRKNTRGFETDVTSNLSEDSLLIFNKPIVLRETEVSHRDSEYSYMLDREPEESNSALPYTVHKKSLPNVNVCSPMDVSIESLTKLCKYEGDHQEHFISSQLNALGVENLIKASLPAKCCRKAVINEEQDDDNPFSPSIKSLPLTNSDMLIISEVAGGDDNLTSVNRAQYISPAMEYYTNFQENFGSNVDYFSSLNKIYEVRFFEIFKRKSDERPGVHSGESKVSQILRKLIYVEDNGDVAGRKDFYRTKRKHNKKCQAQIYSASETVNFKDNIYGYHLENKEFRKNKYDLKDNMNCYFYNNEMCLTGHNDIHRKKHKRSSTAPLAKTTTAAVHPRPKSAYTCNTSCILSTIYESEERKKGKANSKSHRQSLNEKSLSAPIQLNEVEKRNYSEDGCKQNSKIKTTSIKISPTKGHVEPTVRKKKKSKYKSYIPRLVRENCTSDTSSYNSMKRFGEMKYYDSTKSVSPKKLNSNSNHCNSQTKPYKPEISSQTKPYKPEISSSKSNNIISSSTKTLNKIIDVSKKISSECKLKSVSKKNIWENDVKNVDSKSNKNLKNKDCINTVDTFQNPSPSLESFDNIAQSGPGYFTVLRPSCGCPQVSIFIPCYCDDLHREPCNSKECKTLVCSESCKKIILPKSCRVNSETDYPQNFEEENNVNEWVQSQTESEF